MSLSTIEWTHYVFNPWWSCTKVSPACDNCYAEAWARRFGVRWGPGQPRKPASERTWDEPIKWNAKAERDGVRRRVFCASMADVFDNEGPEAERQWLWEVIEETPHLDWLLLTKRIGNTQRMLPERWLEVPRHNVWLGATIADREEMLRDGYKLKAIPALVRFWSVEPMLGDLGPIPLALRPDWVICGGESGHKARPMHPDWAMSLRNQCVSAAVPFFFKQWGEYIPLLGHSTGVPVASSKFTFPDGTVMGRAGKKAAGRLLEGMTWNEFPR